MAHCEVGLQTKVQGDGQEEEGWRLKNRRNTMQSVVKEEPLCRQGVLQPLDSLFPVLLQTLVLCTEACRDQCMRHGHVAFRPSFWLEFKEERDAQCSLLYSIFLLTC